MPYHILEAGMDFQVLWEFFDDTETIYTLDFRVTRSEKEYIENAPWQHGLIEAVRRSLTYPFATILKESKNGTEKVPFIIPRFCDEHDFIDELFEASWIDDE